jgi:hypothetical protein
MANRSSDDLDVEHTDELPVLREPIELGGAEPLLGRVDDTAEHTALYGAGGVDAEVLGEFAARVEEIPALEVQIRTLTDSVRDLEQAVAARDRLIGELEATLAAERNKAAETAAAERRAAARLAVAEGRLAELEAAREHRETATAAHTLSLEELEAQTEAARRDAEAARGEAQALRAELAAKASGGGTADADRLREDNAALAAYIAGRRSWWNESQAAQAELETRVATLARELAARDRRLAAANAFAARESQRAVALRAELVEYARRVEALERELRLLRSGGSPAPQPMRAPESAAQRPAPEEPAASRPTPASEPTAAPEELAPEAAEAPDASPPVLTDAVGAIPPAVEALAQLEAEVEYKRQQVAAQLVELRDREQRLAAAAGELERARRDIAALNTELDESRAAVARLERAVMDKDRALAARDKRIATLQQELEMRLGREPSDSALDPALDPPPAARPAQDEPRERAATPALLCLTGDAPKRFAITKKTVIVGRGPYCDLQILTHFVSREHARLISQGGVTLIEDLGSRNGVFVNSVRVERRQLRQGDVVTIGETQFRFVESMAH